MPGEGIKKLLDNVVIGGESLLNLVSPLVKKCEEITNGNEKEFQRCMKDASYIMLYIVENYQLPPGLRPVEAEHNLDSETRFRYVAMRV